MNADQALLVFLRGSLGAKRERTLDFAGRAKAHGKFLDLLYHELGGLFRKSNIVAQLPETAWALPAFRFRPPGDFGMRIASLRAAYLEDEQNELVITVEGRYGYWRDQTYADLETLVVADSSASNPMIR